MHPAAWAVGFCLAVLTSSAPSAPSALAPRPELAGAPHASLAVADTLVGTVRGVYPDSGYIDVITGTGMAIRVERIRVYESVLVDVEGVMKWLRELERGRIVRVVYRETVEGKVAESIMTLPLRREEGGA